MLNETELTILNGGQLSYGARLLYLTVLLPSADGSYAVLDFDLIKLSLTVCRAGTMGVTVLEKTPSTTEIQNWLQELKLTGLISPCAEQDKFSIKATNSSANSFVTNQGLSRNPTRPDEITEIPDYITNPSDRLCNMEPQENVQMPTQGSVLGSVSGSATFSNNSDASDSNVPWPLLVDRDEACARASFFARSDDENNYSDGSKQAIISSSPQGNLDPLASMRRYAESQGAILTSKKDPNSSRDTPSCNLSNLGTQNSSTFTFNNGDTIELNLRRTGPTVSGKIFAMTREWMPDGTFAELASFTGIPDLGYSREELNDFVTFWALKDVAYDNTSWMLKFIRFLKMKRYQQRGRL